MLNIPAHKLKAVLSHAAKTDVRFYLNGVRIEVMTSGTVYLVATDGTRAFVGRIPAAAVMWTGEPQQGPWAMTIPADSLALALKGSVKEIKLTAQPDSRYCLNDSIVFAPVDGVYPDWRRIVPPAEGADELTYFDWDLVQGAQAALRTWCGVRSCLVKLHARGDATSLVTCADPDAFAIVMSARPGKDTKPMAPRFTPEMS